MGHQTIIEGELIYEAEIQFTEVIEFGVSMEALSSGKDPLPSGGARFDQVFEGTLHGPKIRGKIYGTDYLYVRADGSFQLHLHARIATEDGANIAMSSVGVSIQIKGERETQLRGAVSLYSSFNAYEWLNKLQLWALGSLDPIEGKASIMAYAV